MPATRYLSTLTALCNLPTAPYSEQHVIAWLLDWAANLKRAKFLTVKRDPAGNVYLHYKRGARAKKAPPLVIEAHMDHPGFITRSRAKNGSITAEFRGGVRPSHFKNARAKFWINTPPATGTVAPVAATGHWVSAKVLRVTPQKKADFLAVTLKPLTKEIIPPGSIGMWDLPDARAMGNLFSARVCDDIAGVAAAVCMLDELIADRIDAHVIVLLTRAEEVGFAGVIAAAKNGWVPKNARVIGLETSKAFAVAPQGAGPIIRVGDRTGIFSAGLTHFIAQAAGTLADDDSTFQFQRKLMDGGTCNSTAFVAFGYDAAGICIALGNYHNMTIKGDIGFGDAPKAGPGIAAETIHLGDFAGEVRILVQVAKTIHKYQPSFAAMRTRLEDLHREKQEAHLYATSDQARRQ